MIRPSLHILLRHMHRPFIYLWLTDLTLVTVRTERKKRERIGNGIGSIVFIAADADADANANADTVRGERVVHSRVSAPFHQQPHRLRLDSAEAHSL